MKLYILITMFIGNMLIMCSCCTPDFDLQNLQGSYATENKKVIVMIYPEYIIRASFEGYKLSEKYKSSPYWLLKRDYHIFRDDNRLVLQEGPYWSIGGSNLRILTGNRLRAGNIIDGMTTFYKIPETEAWELLKSWGYDTEKVREASIFSHSHYHHGEKKGELLYDSFKERTKQMSVIKVDSKK